MKSMLENRKQELNNVKIGLNGFPLMKKIFFWVICALFGIDVLLVMGFSNWAVWNYLTIAIYAFHMLLCAAYVLMYHKIVFGKYTRLIVLFNAITFFSFLANGCRTFVPSCFLVSFSSIFFFEFLVQDKIYRNTSIYFVLLGCVSFIAFFCAIYLQNILHPNFSSRIGDFFTNINDVSRYLAFSFLVFFYFGIVKKHYICFLISALTFYLILLTGSISNIIAVLLLTIIFIVSYFKGKNRSISIIVITGMALLMFILLQIPAMSYFKERIDGMIAVFFGKNTGALDYSSEHRLELALQAIYLFLQKPIFGGGFNAVASDAFRIMFAHNNFAEILADFGIFALVVFEILIFYPMSKLKRKNEPLSGFGLFVCFYMMVMQFFVVTYYSKIEYLLLAFVYATIFDVKEDQSIETKQTIKRQPAKMNEITT
jgi:hypothetical protein